MTSAAMWAQAGPGCLGGRLHLCYCYSGWSGAGREGRGGEGREGGACVWGGLVVVVMVLRGVVVCVGDSAIVGVSLRRDYSQVLAGTRRLVLPSLERQRFIIFFFHDPSSSPLMLSLLNMLPTCSRLPPPPVGVWPHNVWTKKHRSVTVSPWASGAVYNRQGLTNEEKKIITENNEK